MDNFNNIKVNNGEPVLQLDEEDVTIDRVELLDGWFNGIIHSLDETSFIEIFEKIMKIVVSCAYKRWDLHYISYSLADKKFDNKIINLIGRESAFVAKYDVQLWIDHPTPYKKRRGKNGPISKWEGIFGYDGILLIKINATGNKR